MGKVDMTPINNVKLNVSQDVNPLTPSSGARALRSLQLGLRFITRVPHLLKIMPTLGRFYRVLRAGTRQDLPVDGDERSWAYGVALGPHRVIVAFNRSPNPVQRRISLETLGVTDGTLLRGITHASRKVTQDGAIDVCLEGNAVRVYMG